MNVVQRSIQIHYLKMLIVFKEIEIKGNSLIIEIDKIKATDGSVGFQIIMEKIDGHYKVISSKITWIS